MTSWADIQKHLGLDADGIPGPATRNAVAKALGVGAIKRTLKKPEAFYQGVRKVTGALDQMQVNVIEALLASAAEWPDAWLAYGLATAWHEAKLRPIEEIGKGRGLKYGKPGRFGGQVPYGRGLVQLTWDDNYERADEELDLGGQLTNDFALALRPDIAVAVLVRGMEEGWFTGKSLAGYLPSRLGTVQQFTDARRIINGADRAQLIADYAQSFQLAIAAGGWA